MFKKTLQQNNKSRLTHTIEIHYLQPGEKKTHHKNNPKKSTHNTFFNFSLTHFWESSSRFMPLGTSETIKKYISGNHNV